LDLKRFEVGFQKMLGSHRPTATRRQLQRARQHLANAAPTYFSRPSANPVSIAAITSYLLFLSAPSKFLFALLARLRAVFLSRISIDFCFFKDDVTQNPLPDGMHRRYRVYRTGWRTGQHGVVSHLANDVSPPLPMSERDDTALPYSPRWSESQTCDGHCEDLPWPSF